ncbi:hypothetical protein SAMN05192549_10359 [Duganella sacchari]|uniref:Uncharacterized protein n=1 Tax=Duganella sacchari TaxID=551987 RepID=A0A1M7M7S2_9BURK|nr:hypothetical protein [Duganella sacchari]SHM86764.1 hypothetical protein SAMN05192549_10359 [Duganella sacchari]
MRNPSLSTRQLADQLLFPGPFDGGLNSGVFVQVSSNEESIKFFGDLAPMLEAGGMLVVVIDAPNLMFEDGLRRLAQLLRTRCEIKCAPVSGTDELTLADALANIMQIQSCTVVLLLGSAQRLPAEPGERVMKAIKAARDCVNLEPNSTGRLLLVATWILPANPSQYVENPHSAFYGATAVNLENIK